jgi:hypothetical protein
MGNWFLFVFSYLFVHLFTHAHIVICSRWCILETLFLAAFLTVTPEAQGLPLMFWMDLFWKSKELGSIYMSSSFLHST